MAEETTRRDMIAFVVPLADETPRQKTAEAGGGRRAAKAAVARSPRLLGIEERAVAEVKADLDALIGQIHEVFADVAASPVGHLKLDGLEIGLAINGSGSIGIATVGAQASITLRFTAA
ncbi:MAG: Pepco domain-containing protein [Acetobacteraceae bacterium]